MGKILWLHGKKLSALQQGAIKNIMRSRSVDINTGDVIFYTMHSVIDGLWVQSGKRKMDWDPSLMGKFNNALEKLCAQLDISQIVINDPATLKYITQEFSNLLQCRGSTYYFKDIPCLVIAEQRIMHTVKYGTWYYLNDLAKLSRWYKNARRFEPRFDLNICFNLDDVRGMFSFLSECIAFSYDIETSHRFITCIGYTGIARDGTIRTYVVPFFNPTKPGNCHWETEADELEVHSILRRMHASPPYKIAQNGSYDNSYLVAYHMPMENYLFDTLHMFHSIWMEAPKKLNEIAAICLDHVRYWKDEGKGDAKDKGKTERVPTDPVQFFRYLRYNGLDCHYTLLNAIYLVGILQTDQLAWARENYNQEFRDQVGPAFAMQMRGMLTRRHRQDVKTLKWNDEYEKNLKDLRTMCDDNDFNPNSPYQVASLLYDVLGAKPLKVKGKKKYNARTADEKVLKIIKTQHPVYAAYIEKIWDTKKPRNNISKYGKHSYNGTKFTGLEFWNDRFIYNLWAAGTETTRYSGREHPFWCGTNPQNVPGDVRDIMVADEGYIFVELDYAQSDAWFMAYTSEDENYIKNISDDRDTHIVHAVHFFKEDYDKLLEAHKKDSDWTDHPITGIRQNTKRIVHGANFLMQGFTLYMTMGHEAVVGAAIAYGFEDAGTWSRTRLVKFCDFMLKKYFVLYPQLRQWQEEEPERVAKNANLATTAYGRTRLFFGNMRTDNAVQRELASFYGQGGTAGNINRSLRNIYWESGLEERGLMLLTQTHDSILTQQRIENFHELTNEVLTIMEEPVTINGRTFSVPVEAKIGFSWGKKCMVTYHKDITIEELREHERNWEKENYPNAVQKC